MKAFVTGAAGFLGRHVVDELQKHGFEIATVVRPTSDVRSLREKNVRLIEGDLRDPQCTAAAAKGADVIVHSAATLSGKWEDFYDINVEATRVLLEHGVNQKVKRFVFVSSVIVYNHSTAIADTTFDELMPYEETEQTYYCKTKIEGEKLVASFHKNHKLPAVILRPAALYGTGGPLFLSRLGFAAGANRYLVIGNGKLPLPLSHVEGVAQAASLVIEKEEAVGQTYNVVENDSLTQNEFFAKVRMSVKPKFRSVKLPYKLARFLSQSADKLLGLVKMTSPLSLSYMRLCATPFYYSSEKIQEELGWRPQSDFAKSIEDMMLWHKDKVQPWREVPEKRGRAFISSTQKLRVGIVGCGVISGPHMNALQRLKNTEVVAACDPLADAREALTKKYQVPAAYEGYQEMLQSEQLDAVHVCTPAQTHAQVSLEAMKKGCHVFVEKPMAMTAAEAKKMLSAAKKYDVRLCVDHNHLFDPVMIKARTVIASGAIGRISFVEAWYGTSYSSDSGSRNLTWQSRNDWAYDMPGRLYQNFISHPISLLLDVMGEAKIQSVQAKYNRVVPHMKTDELRVAFENENMLGCMSLSMAASPRYLFVNVYGTDGTLRVDFLNRYAFLDKPMAKLPRVVGRSIMAVKQAKILLGAGMRNVVQGVVGKYNLYEGNETLIRMFYKSILDGGPSPISPEEGLRSMEIMDEIWKKLPDRGATRSKSVSSNGTNAENMKRDIKKRRKIIAS